MAATAALFESRRLKLEPCDSERPEPKKSGKSKGLLSKSAASKAFCHVCIATRGIYAWRDQDGQVALKEDGSPYAITTVGCGACGVCETCIAALACDGQIVAWVLPQRDWYPVRLRCLAETALCVDYAPTSRATCNLSDERIAQRELRLVVVVPKHTGEADSAIVFRLHAARAFLRVLWAQPELAGFDVSGVRGVAAVAPEHRDWVIAALRGEDGPAAPPATSATNLRGYAKLGFFTANYPMECNDCKPGKHKLADPATAGQKTKQLKLSAFF